jgi:hypothetical protein
LSSGAAQHATRNDLPAAAPSSSAIASVILHSNNLVRSAMAPRKRKQDAEQQQHEPVDAIEEYADREQVARKVQDKLKALDRAGEV